MSLFKGMSEAKARRDGDYTRPGSYLCYLDNFITKTNRGEIPVVIFEMVVVAVLDVTNADKVGKPPHRVGERISWVMQLPRDTTKPNVKRALMNITGVPETMVDDSFCNQLASSAQPLRGLFVECSGQEIKTKAGNPFTQTMLKRAWSSEELKRLPGLDVTLQALSLSTAMADSGKKKTG
jgi:hypothetical protein